MFSKFIGFFTGYSDDTQGATPDHKRLAKGTPSSRQALIYRHCRNLERVLEKRELQAMKRGELGAHGEVASAATSTGVHFFGAAEQPPKQTDDRYCTIEVIVWC